MSNSKHDIRLLVKVEKRDWDTSTIGVNLTVVEMTPDGVRSPLFSTYGDPADVAFETLAELTLNAIADAKPDGESWFGYTVDYRRPYRVNLAEAEHMVKVLRKVQRHLDRENERNGYALDFAQWASRVAEAIGARSPAVTFGWRVPPDKDYNGTGFHWGNVNELRYHLDDALKEARK